MLHFFHFSIAPVREEDNLLGDERHFCVRLSNQILANTVTFLLLMAYFRPKLWLMLEQPLSSWCFKQKNVLEAISRWNLRRFLTYLGCFGHDLMKGTHLMSNLGSLQEIERWKHHQRVQRKDEIVAAAAAGRRIKSYVVKDEHRMEYLPTIVYINW